MATNDDVPSILHQTPQRVFYAHPADRLVDAYHFMLARSCRHLLILDDGKVAGILSDRDVLRISTPHDGQLHIPDVTVKDAMSATVVIYERDTTINEIARTMIDFKIDAIPLTDSSGYLKGLVTSSDLMNLLVSNEERLVDSGLFCECTAIDDK